MRVEKILACLWLAFIVCGIAAHGQSTDSAAAGGGLMGFPSRLLGKIQSKTSGLDDQLTRQTQRYLARMAKQERRLKQRMYKLDSSSANKMFGDVDQRYAALARKIGSDTGRADVRMQGPYMAYVDSMKTSLAFLQQHPSLAGGGSDISSKLQGASGQFQQLQARLEDATEIKQFIQQRKEQIRQYLQQYTHLPPGVSSVFSDYKKQAYYYSQQLQSYKDELNDPDKLMQRGLQALHRLPAFNDFVKKNSMLASLFNIPAGGGGPSTGDVQGMATRDQVMAAVRGSSLPGSSADPAAGLQQNVNNAQGQVDQLRDKLSGAGGGNGDLDIPDFKPNNQKTRSFFRRLEFGMNLQSAHSTYYFPTTTDIGVSLGYKIDDKNVVGVGASYKVGWGSDISHVKVSGQGIGLRSFTDIHISKSFFASGGFEYNYQQPFNIQGVPGLDSWQKSGLIGVSKIISMKSRALKNAKIQLLWDFLSYQQAPKAQPLKFRIGYSF